MADPIDVHEREEPHKRAVPSTGEPLAPEAAPLAAVAPRAAPAVSFHELCARRPVALVTSSSDQFVFSTLPPANGGNGGAGVVPLPRKLLREVAVGQSGFSVHVRYVHRPNCWDTLPCMHI
jgi:hypothetical protein